MSEAPEQSNMVDKNCYACVALSLLKKSDLSALPAGIVAFLAGVSLCLAPRYFPGGGILIGILLPIIGMLFFGFVIMAGEAIIWGEDYWVFYACDHEGQPIERLHVHRDHPVVGMKPGDPTARRYLASVHTGPTDSLSATKLGHQHADVMEVDGPFFRLRTGWLVQSQIHNCFGVSWKIVGFRINDSQLELDLRSIIDLWSQLRLNIEQAVKLLGDRSSQPNATGSDLKIREMITAGRNYVPEKTKAETFEHLWNLARACLLGIGEQVTATPERSLVAQKIRNAVWTCFDSARYYLPPGPQKELMMTQHRELEAASARWHAAHGSSTKPPRTARTKQTPAAVPTEAAPAP